MRVEGWESLLADHLQEAYRSGFASGSRDFALWCADWVFTATGEDFGASWRGKYRTELGAAKLMKKRGFASPAAIADAALPSRPVPLAQRGDLVLDPDGCLGICNGRHSHFVTDGTVTTRETLACARAWKVG